MDTTSLEAQVKALAGICGSLLRELAIVGRLAKADVDRVIDSGIGASGASKKDPAVAALTVLIAQAVDRVGG